MEEITLCPMTRELCHQLFRGWENDPDIYMDLKEFKPYQYNEDAVNRYFSAKQEPTRVLLAIMKGPAVIGEIQLKQIDWEKKECALSIHLQNDRVKGQGFGTQAEKLAAEYAFDILGMNRVNADAIAKNTRSQHVLEKAGFRPVGEDGEFKYYRYDREDFLRKNDQ